MTQTQYEIIIKCIEHGVPALASSLITSFNEVISDSNELQEAKRAAVKAEKAKAEKANTEKAK